MDITCADQKGKMACISGVRSIFFSFLFNLQSSEVDCTQLGAQWLKYLLILCVRGNNAISYLQRRLVAATDHCCACKQLVLALRRLTRTTPSFVRSLVCSLPSLFASIVLRMYYTSQVRVLKAAVTFGISDYFWQWAEESNATCSKAGLIYTAQLWLM